MKSTAPQQKGRPEGASPDIYTAPEAAAYLQISIKSLENLRLRGRGPVYSKPHGVGVRYLKADLDAYIQQSRVRHLPLPRA